MVSKKDQDIAKRKEERKKRREEKKRLQITNQIKGIEEIGEEEEKIASQEEDETVNPDLAALMGFSSFA
jgi:hypothetical protein